MPYSIEYYCMSHTGLRRKINQDNFVCERAVNPTLCPTLPELFHSVSDSGNSPVFGVFDGMGGEQHGEAASLIASQTLFEALERMPDISQKPIHSIKDSIQFKRKSKYNGFLSGICRDANRKINEYVNANSLLSMGTTAAMVQFADSEIRICNIGDSRIYRICDTGMTLLSQDHVAFAPANIKAPLYQYLGIPEEEGEIEPYEAIVPAVVGDTYLICSDGLTDMLSDERIAEILTNYTSPAASQMLLDEALANGGTDNVTFIVLYVVNSSKQRI